MCILSYLENIQTNREILTQCWFGFPSRLYILLQILTAAINHQTKIVSLTTSRKFYRTASPVINLNSPLSQFQLESLEFKPFLFSSNCSSLEISCHITQNLKFSWSIKQLMVKSKTHKKKKNLKENVPKSATISNCHDIFSNVYLSSEMYQVLLTLKSKIL